MCSQWKFHKVALEMLLLLVRHDTRLPTSAVQLFVDNLVNKTINVRKVCASHTLGRCITQYHKVCASHTQGMCVTHTGCVYHKVCVSHNVTRYEHHTVPARVIAAWPSSSPVYRLQWSSSTQYIRLCRVNYLFEFPFSALTLLVG